VVTLTTSKRSLTVILAACLLFGCSEVDVDLDEDRVTPGNPQTIPQVEQFVKLYPLSHRLTVQEGKRWRVEWQTIIHDRYHVEMKIDLAVGNKAEAGLLPVRAYGPISFSIQEYLSVDPNGVTMAGLSSTFGTNEWTRLCAAGGDFSVLGLSLRTNAPIPGIQREINIMRHSREAAESIRAYRANHGPIR
jgi:hypothetical protein